MLTLSQRRVLAAIDADLARLIRYDDESLVHDNWIRQRYDCGCYPAYGPARSATVRTAWHEAGLAVAAFAGGEIGAWRHSEAVLVPLRPKIRHLARALLVYPRHLPYAVVAALVDHDE